jgi:hypothetical protein
MYFASYHFDGDPDTLAAAYHRLMASYLTESIELQVAIRRTSGLTVYDACPDEQSFRVFSTSAEFHQTLSAEGLPEPRIEGLGEIEATVLPRVTR